MPSILSTDHPDWEAQARALRGEPVADILKKLGIREYSKNILKMSKEELFQEFGRGAKRLNKSLFIKNVIWQTWQRLQAGETPFDIGNIRSFWYYIKDTMDRAGATKTGDPYNIVSDMFVLMVKAGLFHYRDWGFDDDNQGSRWMGNKNRHIILFAEKTSYTDLLQGANQIYDITAIAAGGQSSYLSIEYFVHELQAQGTDLNQEFFVFSIVDFDPSGDTIATKFIENLKDNGIKKFRVFPGQFYKNFLRNDLVIPSNMTKEQRQRVFRLPLKVRRSGQAEKWADRTGGVDGKKSILYGIETIVMPKTQLLELFEQELAKVATIDLEQIAKRRAMKDLNRQMREFALWKLQHEG